MQNLKYIFKGLGIGIIAIVPLFFLELLLAKFITPSVAHGPVIPNSVIFGPAAGILSGFFLGKPTFIRLVLLTIIIGFGFTFLWELF